ncbi:hypothetical protein POM88_047369 [Heracleum sosnowskyi]|uniref:beta-glucosidase n=1 Tax=Heracleum sosnowskyi TaxID=360622 RepID=A0AAD8GT89_9APIA|nr:hypothetical protein POM88_047369 [Heracleum sosnowskyi]
MPFRRELQLSWCLIQVGMVSRCMLIMILLLIISRENWDFGGIVISDYEGIDRITTPPHADYTYSLQASILAGLDMVSSMAMSFYALFLDYPHGEILGSIASGIAGTNLMAGGRVVEEKEKEGLHV